jgi:hypothetical protein
MSVIVVTSPRLASNTEESLYVILTDVDPLHETDTAEVSTVVAAIPVITGRFAVEISTLLESPINPFVPYVISLK